VIGNQLVVATDGTLVEVSNSIIIGQNIQFKPNSVISNTIISGAQLDGLKAIGNQYNDGFLFNPAGTLPIMYLSDDSDGLVINNNAQVTVYQPTDIVTATVTANAYISAAQFYVTVNRDGTPNGNDASFNLTANDGLVITAPTDPALTHAITMQGALRLPDVPTGNVLTLALDGTLQDTAIQVSTLPNVQTLTPGNVLFYKDGFQSSNATEVYLTQLLQSVQNLYPGNLVVGNAGTLLSCNVTAAALSALVTSGGIANITGAASSIVAANLSPSVIVVSNSAGKVISSNISTSSLNALFSLSPNVVVVSDSSGKVSSSNVTVATLNALVASGGTANITGAASSIVTANLSPSVVVVSDSSGKVSSSNVTVATLNALVASGGTANITGAASSIVTANLSPSVVVVSNSAGKVISSNISTSSLNAIFSLSPNVVVVSDSSGKVAASNVTVATLNALVASGGTANITGAASSIVTANLSPSVVVVSDSSGKVSSSNVTVATLNALVASGGSANITGAASTIVTANLAPNVVVVSDSSGKVAASTINISTLQAYITSSPSNGALQWLPAGSTHTIPWSGVQFASTETGGSLAFVGIFITNQVATNPKQASVLVSINKTDANSDLATVWSHANSAMGALAVSQSSSGIVVATDSDCVVAWCVLGATPTSFGNVAINGVITNSKTVTTGFTGGPALQQSPWSSVSGSHTLDWNSLANGSDNITGMLYIHASSKGSDDKNGIATASVIKSLGKNPDVMVLSLHKSANLSTLEIAMNNAGALVVNTDPQCAVCCSFVAAY
jgi:hypothetical protein